MNTLVKFLDQLMQRFTEPAVAEFSAKILEAAGFSVSMDTAGNVRAKRGEGKLPLLSAHMDTRQELPDYTAIRNFYRTNETMLENGEFKLKDVQIGGDDKCGVAIILLIATKTKLPFKVLLTTQEEVGSIGVQTVGKDFYDDVLWAVSLDRRHGTDIIDIYHGLTMTTDGFLEQVVEAGNQAGIDMKPVSGSMSDTYYICNPPILSAVNLSVGFYGEHRPNDHIKVNETYNIAKTVMNLLKNIGNAEKWTEPEEFKDEELWKVKKEREEQEKWAKWEAERKEREARWAKLYKNTGGKGSTSLYGNTRDNYWTDGYGYDYGIGYGRLNRYEPIRPQELDYEEELSLGEVTTLREDEIFDIIETLAGNLFAGNITNQKFLNLIKKEKFTVPEIDVAIDHIGLFGIELTPKQEDYLYRGAKWPEESKSKTTRDKTIDQEGNVIGFQPPSEGFEINPPQTPKKPKKGKKGKKSKKDPETPEEDLKGPYQTP